MTESFGDEVTETSHTFESEPTNDIQRALTPATSSNHHDLAEDQSDLNDENISERPQFPTDVADTEPSINESIADFEADEGDDDNTEDINVIIKPTTKTGIYKTGATYQARSTGHSAQNTKSSRGIELDDPGDIHGVPTLEFNLSSLGEEEKPWKRPGADITDYFNYGFTEETWIQYCEKQKILRQEYANATLKPVLSTGGTGLLQRLRTNTSALSNRQIDNFKQANINVINLSNNVNARGLLTAKGTDASATILNGVSGNSTGLLGAFTQPPPGYPAVSAQSDGSASFNAPPPGFPATQILTGANAAATAGIFPNLTLPPPLFNTLSSWPGAVGVPGLLAADAIIDPATGQISTILDRSNRSPESVYSHDDHSSRRKNRHYRDDGSYFERESYRSRRRSRSDSRDRYHSRSHRHRETGRTDRDYDRRPTRRSYRSRDRFSRDDRFSAGGHSDDIAESENFPAPASATSYSRGERSSRDRSRDDPGRSTHRNYKRERDRSTRSSRPSRHRSGSRSPRRREGASLSSRNSPIDDKNSQKTSADPLLAAKAAAANITMALVESGSGKSIDS